MDLIAMAHRVKLVQRNLKTLPLSEQREVIEYVRKDIDEQVRAFLNKGTPAEPAAAQSLEQ